MPINVSGFNVPATPYREYEGTKDFLNAQIQNKRFQYQVQKEKEADDWRKLNLIRDLTDIDKYQTGEAVADAIGHQKANELFSKYTALAGSMSPAELQYKIAQDIGKTTMGMQGMKDELVQSDAMIKQLKQLHPSLDAQKLTQDYRADVLNRRIENNDFANPLKANNPASIDLTNPDVLSDYIDVNKGLKEAVVNPKNIQKNVTVLRGSPSSYVGYEGDLPFFMKDTFQTKGGFYNDKAEPTMALKTDIVPQGAFSGADKPIEVLDKGAYDALASENPDAEMALRKLAKTKYKNYNEMSDSEKEIARRDVAKDFIQPFSTNFQYRAKSATKPPHNSQTTINKYGADEMQINDIYNRIDKEVNRLKDAGVNRFHVGILDSDAQKLILDFAKEATGDKEISNKDVFIEKSDKGDLNLWDANRNLIGTLPRVGVNIKVQPSVKEKRAVIEQGNVPTKQSSEYSNITETNKGTIGIKNGKWYDIKTGKPIQ